MGLEMKLEKKETGFENKPAAAIVTGASSGIGLAICEMLCANGYEVYGIGRNFEASEAQGSRQSEQQNVIYNGEQNEAQNTIHNGEQNEKQNTIQNGEPSEERGINLFHQVVCDVLDTKKLCGIVKDISSKTQVKILVNNAGVGFYGLHEELNPEKIMLMVRTNLEVPMILTQQLMRELKKNKGYIINVSSVTAHESNPHGCAYGATKAGLTSFTHSIFDEARKYGVKAVAIHPDMTRTQLYRNADFENADEKDAYLEPKEVAEAVEYVINAREGMVISDITLKPQLHRIKRK